jgi:hypothetical protein
VTPLDKTAHQRVNFGHKGSVGEVRKDLQVTSIKSSAYDMCHANENVPQSSAGLDFQSIVPENGVKIASAPLCPDQSKNVQFAICVGDDTDHYAGCTVHSCRTCRKLGRA